MITIKTTEAFIIILAFKDDDHTFATGIVPAITVYDSSGNIIVNAQNMTEIGNGGYQISFPASSLNEDTAYYVSADGGATLDIYRYQAGAFYGNAGNENNLDQQVSLAGSGAGNTNYCYKLTEVDTGENLAGIFIWLTTDSAGLTRVTNKVRTNDVGNVEWTLSAGTYYVWTAYSDTYIDSFTIA